MRTNTHGHHVCIFSVTLQQPALERNQICRGPPHPHPSIRKVPVTTNLPNSHTQTHTLASLPTPTGTPAKSWMKRKVRKREIKMPKAAARKGGQDINHLCTAHNRLPSAWWRGHSLSTALGTSLSYRSLPCSRQKETRDIWKKLQTETPPPRILTRAWGFASLPLPILPSSWQEILMKAFCSLWNRNIHSETRDFWD